MVVVASSHAQSLDGNSHSWGLLDSYRFCHFNLLVADLREDRGVLARSLSGGHYWLGRSAVNNADPYISSSLSSYDDNSSISLTITVDSMSSSYPI